MQRHQTNPKQTSRARRVSESESENESAARSKRRRADRSAIRFIEVGLMREKSGHGSASFVGSASGIHFIRSVYSAVQGSEKPSQINTPESDAVPGEDDRLEVDRLPASLWQPQEIDTNAGNARIWSFTFNELLNWTQSYFDIWHPAFPFLHAPSVLEYFEELSQCSTLPVQSFDLIIVRGILSISIADCRQAGAFARVPPASLTFTSFNEALESIQPAITKPATLKALQAVVCVQLFLTSMLRHNAASRLGGLIIRMAYQLGLHRCPARFPSITPAETELRQRLFWSIYILDRQISQALGLPLMMRDDDLSVCMPGDEHHLSSHADISNVSTTMLRDGQEQTVDDRLRLHHFLVRHAEIKGLIMELRNKNISNRRENFDEGVLINAKITQWWNDIEDYVDQSDTHNVELKRIHRAALTVLKHESIIALNRPLLASSRKSAQYTGALHTCIGASKAIITELSGLTTTNNDTEELTHSRGNEALPLFWPSFTWSVWMSAFILIYAAAEGEMSVNNALRNTNRTLSILGHLTVRGSIWPEACAVAIRDLQATLLRRREQIERVNKMSRDRQPLIAHSSHSNSTPNPQRGASYSIDTQKHLPVAVRVATPPQHAHYDRRSVHLGTSAKTYLSRPASPQAANRTNCGETEVSAANVYDPGRTSLGQPINTSQSLFEPSPQEPWFVFPQTDSQDPILQQYSDLTDPLSGFDIPFWMDQDNCATLIRD